MSDFVLTKSYDAPQICRAEILRYAGCRQSDEGIEELLSECIEEAKDKLVYKVCYKQVDVKISKDCCDFGTFCLTSQKLAKTLKKSEKAVIFAATVGVEIDRLIAKYGKLSATKALLFQALGTERIEALCDTFCKDIEKEYGTPLTQRFSPGYADLSLEAQLPIFELLNCQKHIGLTLCDSLLMSPSKSVTAIVGLDGKGTQSANKCSMCENDCQFRG